MDNNLFMLSPKCLAPTYLGDFALSGKCLREKGINRIGNLLVPNDNYCKFEDWIMPILDRMVSQQKEEGIVWSPSKMIQRLGEEIKDESSIYYWAAKNKIPVFSPALTDGSIGDMLYFHSYKNPGLVLDIVQGTLFVVVRYTDACPRLLKSLYILELNLTTWA